MAGWKKIVALVGFSMCTAVFGAACTTTENTDLDETQDLVNDTAAAETAAAVEIDPPDIHSHSGYGRCQDRCRSRFDRCLRRQGLNTWRQCLRERVACLNRCNLR